MSHTFHIPVLGLGYSIDTPLKVARYGISSTVSIVDDELIERMREYHSKQNSIAYQAIKKTDIDYRSKRITAYLNLLNELVDKQFDLLQNENFDPGTDICRYFGLLPDNCPASKLYQRMLAEDEPEGKALLQNILKTYLKKGAIDVNIMAKVDKINYGKDGISLGEKFTDALASLRGFAESDLNSCVVLSAGMNPKLYSYLSEFADFYPTSHLPAKKKVILKVSDFRSALIQAKFLAKKGIWVHEFRIESGLNCGGHAFATEGFLLGPILEEFKQKREAMLNELYLLYHPVIKEKVGLDSVQPSTKITVQGGIGTSEENDFLIQYYQLDGTGWGSPFLLVPEATNVDENTLNCLKQAVEDDFYISSASPLGIPFNNFKKSSSETLRIERISKGKPGSPCTKKFLVSNTEFTKEPICTASRQYQKLKIEQLGGQSLPEEQFKRLYNDVVEKVCLCQGLCTSAYIKNDILKAKENKAVAICPGPNTAYFSKIYSLDEMVKHIYGKINLLSQTPRPHIFINELKLYVDYLKKDIEKSVFNYSEKNIKRLQNFKAELLKGIEYYRSILPEIKLKSIKQMEDALLRFEGEIEGLGLVSNRD